MSITNPQLIIEAWPVILFAYLVFCWGIPMLGMTTNKWANEGTPQENRFRYWEGVRFFSGLTHLALVLTGVLFYFLEPYLVPVA